MSLTSSLMRLRCLVGGYLRWIVRSKIVGMAVSFNTVL